jgi:hypothetical protein
MIREKLMQDIDSFQAGILIAGSINGAKIEVIRSLMHDLKEKMKTFTTKYNLIELDRNSEYSYEKMVDTYYQRQESSYPGINYRVASEVLPEGWELWFRIEIDYRLFAGFCLYNPNNQTLTNEVKKKIRKYIRMDREDDVARKSWWLTFCYLPNGSQKFDDNVPNFKEMNPSAIKLVDAGERAKLVDTAVKMIEDRLLTNACHYEQFYI